jgi:hypothetical protein
MEFLTGSLLELITETSTNLPPDVRAAMSLTAGTETPGTQSSQALGASWSKFRQRSGDLGRGGGPAVSGGRDRDVAAGASRHQSRPNGGFARRIARSASQFPGSRTTTPEAKLLGSATWVT